MKTYNLDSPEIQYLCAADERLALVIRRYGDLTYTLHNNPFAHTVETIVGQMLSSKAADAITARLYSLCGGSLAPETVGRLDVSALRSIGLSGQKAEYVLRLATLLCEQPEFLIKLHNMRDEEVISRLTMLHGIGVWSAKMYLIFVLDRPDVLPFEDGAFLQAYKWLYQTSDLKPSAIKRQCAPWSPYSSLATRYMYHALDSGMIRV